MPVGFAGAFDVEAILDRVRIVCDEGRFTQCSGRCDSDTLESLHHPVTIHLFGVR